MIVTVVVFTILTISYKRVYTSLEKPRSGEKS